MAAPPARHLELSQKGVPDCEVCGLPVREVRWVTKPPDTGNKVFKNSVHQRCRVLRAKAAKKETT